MAKFDHVPVDVLRHHIIPFLNDSSTVIQLGGVNSRLRESWLQCKEDVIQLASQRIPQLKEEIKVFETESQKDETPGLSKELYFAAREVNSFNFNEVNWDDEKFVQLCSLFLLCYTNTEITDKDEIMTHLNKEFAIKYCEKLDVKKATEEVKDSILSQIRSEKFKEIEQEYEKSKENVIVQWIKTYAKYITKMFKVKKLYEQYEEALVNKRGFERAVANRENIWH
ncbi:unnamed protein product [Blepharisma stoltei]|uniref:Uncharacterized protein n=1 Tax=Blepharisma stoltei TaxID=1481888 RepID=A0AAU9IYH2_9CILI|nr:unnamed protein product [Blepharisma stoltei]